MKIPRKSSKMKSTMARTSTHLYRRHRMYFRVLYGEVNHRKEVSGRLQPNKLRSLLSFVVPSSCWIPTPGVLLAVRVSCSPWKPTSPCVDYIKWPLWRSRPASQPPWTVSARTSEHQQSLRGSKPHADGRPQTGNPAFQLPP